MTIQDLRDKNLILFECVSGSRAYGLSTPLSDTDLKGVFILPKEQYYGLDYLPQVSNETNDEVFYEWNRFVELLSVNNPNILELLNSPASCILQKHPVIDVLFHQNIVSKLCANTFGKFAVSQIKKAKGLKKKIVNPIPKEKKTVLDFCYVPHEQGTISVLQFLEKKQWNQEICGLIRLAHMRDVYGLYYDPKGTYKGIIKTENSNDVSLSTVEKGATPETILYFNKDGYSTYCKEYKEYWEWVEKRNDERFKMTESHGKNYDSKNMMHVFRLLEMAIEIAETGQINVQRPNRAFLLDIKTGKFEYDELLTKAYKLQEKMNLAFEKSSLPDTPDINALERVCVTVRDRFYALSYKSNN